MTVVREWTDDLDPVLRDRTAAEGSGEVVGSGGEGLSLAVREPGPLARLTETPAGARLVRASVATRDHALRLGEATARGVWTATVTAPARPFSRGVARYVSGRLLVGQERTDATFARDGRRQPLDVAGESSRWVYLARWKRAAVRLAVLLSIAGLANIFVPVITMTVGLVLATVTAVWGAWGCVEHARMREHTRTYLRPLHAALSVVVDPPASRPQDWLRVPVDFKTREGAEIRIELPAAATGDVVTQIVKITKEKLGLDSESRQSRSLAGNRPYVTLREPVRPPRSVGLADIMPFIEQAPGHRPVIGLAAGNKPFDFNLRTESPHVMVVGGTGAGKSTLTSSAFAQGLSKGALGIIIDYKRISHTWAYGLPNVEYQRSIESIHDCLVRLHVELERRTRVYESNVDINGEIPESVSVGPRIVVLLEEMNATLAALRTFWEQTREKDDPKKSPAIDAFFALTFMSRAVDINMYSVAQMGTVRAFGGSPEGRENFGIRCLARYSPQAWKMLSNIWPMPKNSRIPGRWQIVAADEVTEVQVARVTAAELRDLAQRGIPAWRRSTTINEHVSEPNASHDPDCLGQQGETVLAEPVDTHSPADSHDSEHVSGDVSDQIVLVSLREAVDNNFVEGLSLAALRRASNRDAEFPEPSGKRGQQNLYSVASLTKWVRNRPRAAVATIETESE